MTEQEIKIKILLSTQRALLGTITPNIPLITIGWEQLKTLTLRVYYDSTPDDDDIG